MELKTAMDGIALGTLLAEDLPEIALQSLTDGNDSPSLRQLAVSQGADSDDIRRLFAKALAELGLIMPTPAEAGFSLAKTIAQSVLKNEITAYSGAKRIWSEIYTRFPELDQLRSFVGLASEYEDDENHREEYSNDIIKKCQQLLSE
ncbi:MAG: hypothetical protein U0570_00490 [Phycisphaerales bacterium]